MRMIDADALKSALWETWGYNSLVAEICEFVDEQPTIQSDEPRVMTLEEVLRSSQKIGVPCWVEDHVEGIGVVLFPAVVTSDDIYIQYTGNDYYEGALYHWAYNKRLRCWTAKPTDDQRKAAKWDA